MVKYTVTYTEEGIERTLEFFGMQFTIKEELVDGELYSTDKDIETLVMASLAYNLDDYTKEVLRDLGCLDEIETIDTLRHLGIVEAAHG
jgi:hypothetical protein